jgi:hypothetical protein
MENRTDYSGGRVNVQTPQGGGMTVGQHQYYAPNNLFGDAIAARQQQMMALTQPPRQQSIFGGSDGGGGGRTQMAGPPVAFQGGGSERSNSFQDQAMRNAAASRAMREADMTPAALGRFQMNHTGNWGTFVDPANIPAHLQDSIMGGFYGQAGNWDTSNPSIMGPQQWKTGKYTHSGGGGGPVSGAPDAATTTGGYVPGVGYNGGGAEGPGADFARAQQLAALARSNYESTRQPAYQPINMKGNYGG